MNSTEFLKLALPKMHMRWPGFKKVKGQVIKRINKRMKVLNLDSYEDYLEYLESNIEEWEVLDSFCPITISRFYRDYGVFDTIGNEILPQLALEASNGKVPLKCWSVGCASGEEPYSLSLIFQEYVSKEFPGLDINILATDIGDDVLKRAVNGIYPPGSLRELPENLIREGFIETENGYCLKQRYRDPIEFKKEDIRHANPVDKYHIIFCRYLVGYYFDEELQSEVFQKLADSLYPGGYMILGSNEIIPSGVKNLSLWNKGLNIYRKE